MPPTAVSHYFLSWWSQALWVFDIWIEAFSVIFSIGVLWVAGSRSLCCLHVAFTLWQRVTMLGVALLAWYSRWSASVHLPSSSRLSPVRILFGVFCWSVPLWQLSTLGRYFLFPPRWGPVAGTQKQSLMKTDPLAAHELAGFWPPVWAPGG